MIFHEEAVFVGDVYYFLYVSGYVVFMVTGAIEPTGVLRFFAVPLELL